jgi:hypothetical protein
MVTIEWHWLIYIPVMLAGMACLIFGEEENRGYINIPFGKTALFCWNGGLQSYLGWHMLVVG